MRNDVALESLDVWNKDYPGSWHGRRVAHGGVSDADFAIGDVSELVASASTEDRSDGTTAAIFRLHDGRWVSFESFYGPTGSGFSEDAYGGNADIHLAPDLETIIRWGLTDEGRELLGVPRPWPGDNTGGDA